MRNIRISIFAITALLISIGVVMIYSSSAIYAYENMGDSLLFLKKHLLFLVIGLIAGFGVMLFDYRLLKRHSRAILMIAILLLLLVLIPSFGSEVGGARRWFKIANFSFQPSEMAKLALIIYLADFLSRKGHDINRLAYGLFPIFAVAGVVMGLILLQPDLGTTVLIASFTLILLFSANIKWSYLTGLFGLSVPVLYFLIYRVPYRWNRILAFIDPWRDPKGTGFQIIQSFLALGSGGVLGVGLGMSKQKLFYLPEAHTDFIFSIIGEELGLVGTLSVTLLFMALIWQGMRAVLKTEDSFGRFMGLGIVSMIALEVVINIGVTIGALPTKGMPLPFISYGGTALVIHMVAIGLLLNIIKNSEEKRFLPTHQSRFAVLHKDEAGWCGASLSRR
ncbi:MAG: putative lipid II flippase FtsW [Candidatus Omnitrophota bacterium]